MLCGACQRIFQGELISGDWEFHHTTRQELQVAAEQESCHICAQLWRSECLRKHAIHLPSGTKYKLDSSLKWLYFKTNINTGSILHFILSRVKDSNPPILAHRVSPSTSSDACTSLALSWLETCTKQHSRCNKSLGSRLYFPTRLINIGSKNGSLSLRIHETSKELPRSAYMTLSHRWGTAEFLKLTIENYENLKRGFSVSDLPKTFREAIMITQNFGINFLWIDSLCILQDSDKDWRQESASMGDVYQNSACNIAVTSVSSIDEGCFVNRNTHLIYPCRILSSWDLRRNYCYEIFNGDFWRENVVDAPLNRRGWVVQERLLAPRVIYYGGTQLFWECHEVDACETCPDGMNHLGVDYMFFDGFKRLDIDSCSQRLEKWSRIVQTYTSSALTKPDDKLVAISGLATKVQSRFGGQYLAGLWRESLASQLLWYCGQYDDQSFGRVPTYRAPSWSWAAVDGSIVMLDRSHLECLVTITGAHVVPLGDDVMGQVKGGHIELSGTILKADFHRYSIWQGLSISGTIVTTSKDRVVTLFCEIHRDDASDDFGDESRRTTITMLPILSRPARSSYGLILQPVDNQPGVYKRGGLYIAWYDPTHDPSALGKDVSERESGIFYVGDQETITLI